MGRVVKFTSTISKQGDEVRVVVIPKRLHGKINKHLGKQVVITIDEEDFD